MRRDTIFYALFQQSPTLLFELVPDPPNNAAAYRFDSVSVKEPKFEIDGVFLPPGCGTVFFCEVQFQEDKTLYERAFAESALYFYRNRERFSDWKMVFIYPDRATEQDDIRPHRSLLAGDQVHRVYLNELGDIRQLPLWVALMLLTTVDKDQAPEEARNLLSRARQEASQAESRAIIDIVASIISYRFGTISRKEVDAMLGITLKGTRVYEELLEEAQEEANKKLDKKMQQDMADLIEGQLTKRFNSLPTDIRETVTALSLPMLKQLGKAWLDFSDVTELKAWLEKESQ